MGIQSVQNRDANSTHCQPRHMPRQFRIEPHDAIATNGKICGIKDSCFDEVQDRTIDLRPLRLHHVEHKGRRIIAIRVHDAEHWIVALGDEPDWHLALKQYV